MAKKRDITKELVDIVKKRLGDGVDLLGNGYFSYFNYHDLSLEERKLITGWVLDNGFYTDDSFYSFVDDEIRSNDYSMYGNMKYGDGSGDVDVKYEIAPFMLRKYFATRNPVDIAVKLLDNGKYDIANYWVKTSNTRARSRILAHMAKTNEEYYHHLSSTS